MTDDTDNLSIAPAVTESTVYRIIRTGLVLAGGLFLLGLMSVLPGLEPLLGEAMPTLSAIVLAVGTLLVVGALVAMAPAIEAIVRESLDGPEPVISDAAESVTYLVMFVALVIAHQGFAAAVLPVFDAIVAAWLYHLVFLLGAMVPLLSIAKRLYRSLDPLAELFTREVVDAIGTRTGAGSDGHAEAK